MIDKQRQSEENIEKIKDGFDLVLEKLIAFKKYKKTPFIVSRHGEIVALDAETVEAEYLERKRLES